MAGKHLTPEDRAVISARTAEKVRRRYKTNLSKPKKLTPGEIPFAEDMTIVLKIAGYSNGQIGSIIGISRGQVSEILRRGAVTEKMVALRKTLPQAALDLLQQFMPESVITLMEIQRHPGADFETRRKAANDVLALGGLAKASRQERHNVNEERTVFSDDGIVEKLRSLPVEVQEEAAQLIEQLERLVGLATPSYQKELTGGD